MKSNQKSRPPKANPRRLSPAPTAVARPTRQTNVLPTVYTLNSVFFLFLLIILGCTKKERKCTPAFYHWKTELSLSEFEKSYLDTLKVEKLYVKFFDVDQSNETEKARPLALLQAVKFEKGKLQIIPTIFITNRTLRNLDENDLKILSQRILKKINDLRSTFDESTLTEIQIDCDWTLQTRETYFSLLRFLRKQANDPQLQISATIRLHQIKFYKKTGVPPVDRGMLMFYNMGEVDKFETSNSIIDLQIADAYLQKINQYPLDLDLALPIFSWGVVFRDRKLFKLINNLEATALGDTSRFIKANEKQYKVTKSTYLQGHYLYKGDEIRLEASPIGTVLAAAKKLSKFQKGKDLTLSFYHLDSATLKNYTYGQLQSVYDQFE